MQSTSLQRRRAATLVAIGATLTLFVSFVSVGPKPAGKVQPRPEASIAAQRGELIPVTLPGAIGGTVWRVALTVDETSRESGRLGSEAGG
jgi:hypothetical protein